MNYNRMLTGGAASFPYFNGRLQYIEGVVVSTTVASVHWEMIRSAQHTYGGQRHDDWPF